jgi:hypothetical protein
MLAALLTVILSGNPPESAKLAISTDHQEICAYDPLFVRVTLAHREPAPLPLPGNFSVETGEIGFERRYGEDDWTRLPIPGAGMRCFYIPTPIPVAAESPLVRHEKVYFLDATESGVWTAFPKPGPQELRAFMTWAWNEGTPVRLYSDPVRLNVKPMGQAHVKRVYENRRVFADALTAYDYISDEAAAALKESIPTLDDSRLKFALESKLLQWEILTSAGDEQAKRIAGLEAVLGTENSVLRECLFLGLARAYLVRRRYQESLDMVRRLEFDSIELRGIRMTAEYFLKHQSRRQRGAAEGEGNTEKQSKAPATK